MKLVHDFWKSIQVDSLVQVHVSLYKDVGKALVEMVSAEVDVSNVCYDFEIAVYDGDYGDF